MLSPFHLVDRSGEREAGRAITEQGQFGQCQKESVAVVQSAKVGEARIRLGGWVDSKF